MRPPPPQPAALALSHCASGSEPSRSVRARDLVAAHHDFIWRMLRRLGVPSGDIDDATQQVFWVAVQKISGPPSARDASFLLAIALRVAADCRRAQRRRREVGLEHASQRSLADSPADEQWDRVEAARAADLLLETLPVEQRIVFVLFELEERSTEDIARLLDIPVGTVASRLRRARAAFAQAATRFRARATKGARP